MFLLSQQFSGRDYQTGADLYDYEYSLLTGEEVATDIDRFLRFFTPEVGVQLEYAE